MSDSEKKSAPVEQTGRVLTVTDSATGRQYEINVQNNTSWATWSRVVLFRWTRLDYYFFLFDFILHSSWLFVSRFFLVGRAFFLRFRLVHLAFFVFSVCYWTGLFCGCWRMWSFILYPVQSVISLCVAVVCVGARRCKCNENRKPRFCPSFFLLLFF